MQSHTTGKTESIEIVLNGERRRIPRGETLAGLVALLGLDAERVAVEFDRQIVRRTAWESTRLEEGSAVEIVQFVGGG